MMMDVHGFFFLLCCAAVLLLGGAQTGFISIDCGLTQTAAYNNTFDQLTYVSDDGFIDSGVNGLIDRTTIDKGSNPAYNTVRSFPHYTRNCYQLPATVGSKYFVHASFRYGNYDGLNKPPSFDLYLDVNFWDTVNLSDNNNPFRPELVVQAEASYLFVCLVRTGNGTPFISYLKLRPVAEDMYAPANSSLSLVLKTFMRVDVGAHNETGYPQDRFDRTWEPDYDRYGTPYGTSETVRESGDPIFGMPSIVMQTAVYSDEISVNWDGGVDDRFYLLLEFADVRPPADPQSRQMNVLMNGQDWGSVSVSYLDSSVLYSKRPEPASQYKFSIRSDNSSDEGAVLNSFEVYKALKVTRSATDAQEVSALQKIKEFYDLKRNWRGDPCLPVSPWDGLTCNNATTPQILSLDLSNSELNGTIATQFSELTALKTLNLSRNNLKGEIPEFLQGLQNLINIDLSMNDLSGSIPPGLRQKNKTGEIILSIDGNPHICQENQCDQDKTRRKNLIVIPVVVSLVVGIPILLLVVTVVFKRRKQDKPEEGGPPQDNQEMVDSLSGQRGSMGSSKSGTFTYSQAVEMTNNFEKVIGRGGSGTVFYGRLKDGRQVAVKKLSSRLVERGTKEFAAEVKMLMQVHYKHLTPFVGYCDDGKELILVYEYMSNGNIQKLLSEETAAALNWRQRLNIALDAAKGLDYLHSGCTPAFIHRDVKSSNILVNENFEAKVADFGLSKAIVSDDVTHITTAVAGTAGYLDPEYCYTNKVTEKSDVYGFGVVLFELLTGRSAISTNVKGERVPLVQLVRPELMKRDINSVIDPKLQGQYDVNSVWMVAETAMTCTEEKSIIRPTMAEVVAHLKEAMEIERSREKSGSGRKWPFSASSSSFRKTSLSDTATANVDLVIYPSAR